MPNFHMHFFMLFQGPPVIWNIDLINLHNNTSPAAMAHLVQLGRAYDIDFVENDEDIGTFNDTFEYFGLNPDLFDL